MFPLVMVLVRSMQDRTIVQISVTCQAYVSVPTTVQFFFSVTNSAGSEVKCNLHVLSVVLYGCEISYLTFREEHGLRCSGHKLRKQ
jgi:hypothetical protein